MILDDTNDNLIVDDDTSDSTAGIPDDIALDSTDDGDDNDVIVVKPATTEIDYVPGVEEEQIKELEEYEEGISSQDPSGFGVADDDFDDSGDDY